MTEDFRNHNENTQNFNSESENTHSLTGITTKSSIGRGRNNVSIRRISLLPYWKNSKNPISKETIYLPYNDRVDIRKCMRYNSPEDLTLGNDQGSKGWRFLSRFILKGEEDDFKQSIERIHQQNE